MLFFICVPGKHVLRKSNNLQNKSPHRFIIRIMHGTAIHTRKRRELGRNKTLTFLPEAVATVTLFPEDSSSSAGIQAESLSWTQTLVPWRIFVVGSCKGENGGRRRGRIREWNPRDRVTYWHEVVLLKIGVPALSAMDYESKMAKLYHIYILVDTSPPYSVLFFRFSLCGLLYRILFPPFFFVATIKAGPNYCHKKIFLSSDE